MAGTKTSVSLVAASFAGLVTVCVLVVTVADMLTVEKIAEAKLRATRSIVNDIIPGSYTNDIFNDTLQVREPAYLGTDQPVTVYRARNNGEPAGVVFYPVIAEGYNNPIELAVGISAGEVISGVRVIRENETEGLGDQVNQDNTDWVLSFTGRSFASTPRGSWAVSSENGYFDQVSGATITSRSVINAVRNTLDYYNLAGEDLYR